MELYVGSKVRLLRRISNQPVGSIGFVYEIYARGDGSMGASVIFQNGFYEGFAPGDMFLIEHIGEDPRYSMYNFKNVSQVYADYKKGYWDFK
jgi:hypothetical protein